MKRLFLFCLLSPFVAASGEVPPMDHLMDTKDSDTIERGRYIVPFKEKARKAALAAAPKPKKSLPKKWDEELEVDLKNPVYDQGVIKTEEGGVIRAEGFHLQADKLEYINKVENGILRHKVVAEGNLLLEYGGHVFVGERLEYDFVSKTGYLTHGKTSTNYWFVGGEKIELKDDGSYLIYNAYITTSESQEHLWEMSAGVIKITKDNYLSAKKIRFQFIKIPVFWLPSFKMNLKGPPKSAIRYQILWSEGLGPRATMRYLLFSINDFSTYARLDYRLKTGFGGALEMEYAPPDSKTLFQSRNYVAHDKLVLDESNYHRYRFQGLYRYESPDNKTQIHLSYDKMSDDKMPGDFKSDDFEISTQKRTRLLVNHQERDTYASLSVQPRINNFQSLNQELPLVIGGIRPFSLLRTGIISENRISAGYLDYIYTQGLSPFIPNLHSTRIETKNRVYRPIPIHPVTITPEAGFIGIFYSNSPQHDAVGQAVFTYGCEANSRVSKNYSRCDHLVEPYVAYEGFSKPRISRDDHFIFMIDDGYVPLNLLKAGVRNSFYSIKKPGFTPDLSADLYAYHFFHALNFHTVVPKAFLDLAWNRPTFAVHGGVSWNFEEQLLDYSNIRTDWTINDDFAFGVEFRHRSRFAWRKANYDNYMLDVGRRNSELLESPISDGRDTLLTRFQVRLSPKWTCHLESHHGWGRSNEPRYNEFKLDLLGLLASKWQFKFTLQWSPEGGWGVLPALSLMK